MYFPRTVLMTVVGAVMLSVLWTLRRFFGSPSVKGTEPKLQAGTTSTIDIKAHNIGGLVCSSLPEETSVQIDLSKAKVSPRPSFQVDTYPPYWYWRIPRKSVSVEVPISVHGDAEPEKCHYAVRAYNSSDRDRATSVSEEFTITVVDQ